MTPELQLGYLGVEVRDRASFGTYLTDVVGLTPGEPTDDGFETWRNDGRAHRLLAAEGTADDAVLVGFEAPEAAAFEATTARLDAAGWPVVEAGAAEAAARRVARLAWIDAPWGVRVEVIHDLAEAGAPLTGDRVPGGFLTEGVGFGHVVFATPSFEASHRFLTEGLGMAQSDWLETEIGDGLTLEVRFYHCNPRHHTVAIARAPFELGQRLHHLMVEANRFDDVGAAFDRAWNAGVRIANGLGRHDNDGMFSFYAVTPAGFQIEFGHGGRVIGEGWDGNRRYDRISAWGHQPVERR